MQYIKSFSVYKAPGPIYKLRNAIPKNAQNIKATVERKYKMLKRLSFFIRKKFLVYIPLAAGAAPAGD